GRPPTVRRVRGRRRGERRHRHLDRRAPAARGDRLRLLILGAGFAARARRGLSTVAVMSDDTAWLDATAQADLVRKGAVSPLELLEGAIARIEKLNSELNAVIHPLFDRARARAAGPSSLGDGPFRGVPLLLKDLGAELAGTPFCEGSDLAGDYRSTVDQELAKRFERAGFAICGKTNTPEFGTLPTTEPRRFGPSRNPWNINHSTGGSSGGSAAAVASGMVPVA